MRSLIIRTLSIFECVENHSHVLKLSREMKKDRNSSCRSAKLARKRRPAVGFLRPFTNIGCSWLRIENRVEINLKVDFQRRERSVITNEPFERLSHMNTCVVFLSRKPDVSLSVRCNNRSSIHVASFSAIGDDLTVIHLALKLNVQRKKRSL